MYKELGEQLLDTLNDQNIEARKHMQSLVAQKQFVEHLKLIMREAKEKSTRRDIRESALRTKLSKDQKMGDLKDLILPLDPTVR